MAPDDAASRGTDRRVPDAETAERTAAGRTTDRRAAGTAVDRDGNGLSRADLAWAQRLTAQAEAWFRAHPEAVPSAEPSSSPSPSPTPSPTAEAPPEAAAPEPDEPAVTKTPGATKPAVVDEPVAPEPAAPAPEPPVEQPPAEAPPEPAPAPPDYRAEAEAFLDTLPGGATATIEWGDPNGHLGGVWIPGSETIILNAARLDGRLERTKDVLRHEIGHVHQNRAMAAAGVSLADFEARLDALFDGQGIERSADAIALLLGAGSVRYSSSFTDAQYDAARTLLQDRIP
ncbi:hypothetical protein Xcel_3269 [Xylanimonas cellulosilytica DSM 15894]|uniref:Uncharacterized protein n=2 Tax=Xylanimonas TaxID=186188 RepID=D1BRK3_XYLCX|nr:hypothetical protein Xcel_3269 [Xylanimonas cellulosilytica DSM 15894]